MRALRRLFFLPLLLAAATNALGANEALLQKIAQRAVESESDSLVLVQNGHTVYSRA